MGKITSLAGLAGALKSLSTSQAELRKKVAEKMEDKVKDRIFEQGENARGSKIGNYKSKSRTHKPGESINLTDTGKLKKGFGIDKRLNAPDFKFGSSRNSTVARDIIDGGQISSVSAPVFEFTSDEEEEIYSTIRKELADLGLL